MKPRILIFTVIVALLGGLALGYKFNPQILQGDVTQTIVREDYLDFQKKQLEEFINKKVDQKSTTVYIEDLFVVLQKTPFCLEHLQLLQAIQKTVEERIALVAQENEALLNKDEKKLALIQQQILEKMARIDMLLRELAKDCSDYYITMLETFLQFTKPKCPEQVQVMDQIRELDKKLREQETIKKGTPLSSSTHEYIDKLISSLLRDIQEKMNEYESIVCGELSEAVINDSPVRDEEEVEKKTDEDPEDGTEEEPIF